MFSNRGAANIQYKSPLSGNAAFAKRQGKNKVKSSRAPVSSGVRQMSTNSSSKPRSARRPRRRNEAPRTTSDDQSRQNGRGFGGTVKCDGEMSGRKLGFGTGKKRGHQHHPRDRGSRVAPGQDGPPAEGVAAHVETSGHVTSIAAQTVPKQSDNKPADRDNKVLTNASSKPKRGNQINNNNPPSAEQTLSKNENKSAVKSDRTAANHNNDISNANYRVIDTIDLCDSDSDQPKKVEAPKKRRPGRKDRDRPLKEFRDEIRWEPRGSAEGCSGGEGEGDADIPDQDPEIEELSRLRCPSERAELAAERDARRRHRSSDYPGLAFGSSIFSSDTMIRFSLIRNELQNIKNTALKRVNIFSIFMINHCVTCDVCFSIVRNSRNVGDCSLF